MTVRTAVGRENGASPAGIDRPNPDEDDYREMADAVRQFTSESDDHRTDLQQAVEQMAGENAGAAVDVFQARWGKVDGTHIHQPAEGCRLVGTVLDGFAVVITGAKVPAIAQLVLLVTEVIAAQATAPFAFGLSEAGAIGATQATRMIVRRLLEEAEKQIIEQLMSVVTGPIVSALGSMAGELVLQLGEGALGIGDSVDLSGVGRSGQQGFKDGVNDSLGQVGINRGTGAMT
ncbi:hypothetical protein AMK19_11290 [Kitasatospora sp. CB01950]|nr:hypothetical protein AMK19_11290 [Kitasatospora sp. CB01950]